MKENIIRKPGITLAILTAAVWLIGSIPEIPGVSNTIFKCISVILLFAVPFLFYKFRKNDDNADRFELYAFIIIITGFLFRAMYVLVMPYNLSTHDIGTFPPDGIGRIDDGHLGYISYLYNFRHLPDFDPREKWSYYNPPGFHITEAVWYGFNRLLGFSQNVCRENLQIPTLVFSTGIVIAAYKIMLELFPKNKNLLIMLGFVSYLPYFTVISKVVNNDTLAAMLYMVSILYTIRWHKTHDVKNICIIALTVALGMFTKMNNALSAFPIGFVFIYDMIKDRKTFRKYLLQFVLFLAICAPLALFWPIRNYVMYGMAPNYVQRPSDSFFMYMGDIDRIKYIGLPSIDCITYPFVEQTPGTNYNLWLQLIKTGLWDEFNPDEPSLVIIAIAVIYMWSAIAMWIISFISFVRMLCGKKTLNTGLRIFFTILFATLIISEVSFTFAYPFVCTMDFRYIIPIILMPCVAMCSLMNRPSLRKREVKVLRLFFGIFTLFSLFGNVLVTMY